MSYRNFTLIRTRVLRWWPFRDYLVGLDVSHERPHYAHRIKLEVKFQKVPRGSRIWQMYRTP